MKHIIDIEQLLRYTENKHARHGQKSLAMDNAQIYWKETRKSWDNHQWHWTNAQIKTTSSLTWT
jgi:hypothetical protein